MLLDNKDKKRATVPKPQTVRKVVRDPHGVSSSRTLSGSSSSLQNSSYSGLGPGRGNMNRPASPHTSRSQPSSSSSLSSPSSSSVSAASTNSQKNHQIPPVRPPPVRPPPTVNTEIMKRPLRYDFDISVSDFVKFFVLHWHFLKCRLFSNNRIKLNVPG